MAGASDPSTQRGHHPGQRDILTRRILIGLAAGTLVGLGLNFLREGLGPDSPVSAAIVTWGSEGILAFMGQAFLRLLSVLVVPLVLVSLTCGTASLEDMRTVGRVGLRALVLFLFTTALAISLAVGAAVLLRPGEGFALTSSATYEARPAPGFLETALGLIPRNVFSAMAEGQMLQIILFALLLGVALSLSGAPGKRLLSFFQDANEVILKLVHLVMWVAPYGVFGLIARTFSNEGFEAFSPLLRYFGVVLAVLLLHGFGSYALLLWMLARLDPRMFFRKMREVHLFAFSTASSNATLPVTLTTVENRLGVSNPIAAFTVPLGATINMDGTAIMQGVATVFIAQAYGIELGVNEFLMVILTATLASIGTAGVPGVGLVMLGMVLTQVGLPVEGIALIIGIDRLLDMVRTAVNVTGDAMVACVVGRAEGALQLDVYADPLAGLEEKVSS